MGADNVGLGVVGLYVAVVGLFVGYFVGRFVFKREKGEQNNNVNN